MPAQRREGGRRHGGGRSRGGRGGGARSGRVRPPGGDREMWWGAGQRRHGRGGKHPLIWSHFERALPLCLSHFKEGGEDTSWRICIVS